MKKNKLLKSISVLMMLGASTVFAQTQVNGYNSLSIGSGVAGNTSYNSSTSTYTMVAGGNDIDGTSDNFHFLYKSLTGNGRITARIASVTNTDPWTKVGVMVRQNTSATSANAMFLLRPQLGSAGQFRATAGGATTSTWQENPAQSDNSTQTDLYRARYLRPSKWLSATRIGNVVTTYSSDDGLCWNLRTRETITLSGAALIGVALTAHHGANKATAQVSNLSVSTTVPSDINANCPRAQVDGDLPQPTTWIVSPDDAVWWVRTDNPNSTVLPRTCLAASNPHERVDSPESPVCPAETTTSAWATNHVLSNTGWIQNAKPKNTGPAKTIWLRTLVNLTSTTQKNSLMFWGKWSNSVSIYINGKLATNTYRSDLQNESHYLGMNNVARDDALVVGQNLIAVRVDCFNEEDRTMHNGSAKKPVNCSNALTDFGITTNQSLAQLPVNPSVSATSTSFEGKKAEIFTQITKEQGAIGGAFAAYKNGTLVDNRSVGYKDKRMLTAMPSNAILRLASVDKRVTDAVIVHLYNQGTLHPDDIIYGEIITNIQPIAGRSLGANIGQITVEHLRTHRSGLTQVGGGQGWQDEMAFRLNKQPNQITSADLARIYASYNACDWSSEALSANNNPSPCDLLPGTAYTYNSNAFALLRYVAEMKTGMSFNQILNGMASPAGVSSSQIIVSREDTAARPSNEGGYRIINKETRARWFELDRYLALSATAAGLTKFLNFYGPEFTRNGPTFTPTAGGQSGSMDGTRSGVDANPSNGTGQAYIWNSDLAGLKRFYYLWELKLFNRTAGSCNPLAAGANIKNFRLQSYWQESSFVNYEGLTLKAGAIAEAWESAKWRIEPVDSTYYRIRSAWSDAATRHLAVIGSGNDQAVTAIAVTGTTIPVGAQWRVVKVDNYMRLENRAGAGGYLNIENGTLRINPYASSFDSTRWHICE